VLTLAPQYGEGGKNRERSVWITSTANLPAARWLQPKGFSFHSPSYIFPNVNLFLPFL
jgi:hypothetical protein